MQAAIFTKGKLVLTDVPKPAPKAEETLVKITAAGVCHSDIHLVRGDWTNREIPFPLPMGHEGIGIVEEVGPGAEKYVKAGDRVILGLGGSGGGYWCGACEYCLSGRSMMCKEGKGILGTYAEYIALWAKSLVKLPEAIADSEVSLACGGLTAYGAVSKLIQFGVKPGKPVAIIGAAGGLGHYAVQIAKAFGYKVLGVDVGAQKVEFIKTLGADMAVAADETKAFVKQKIGGVYASIVFSSKIAGFQLGFDVLGRGGLLICVGMPALSEGGLSITPLDLLKKGAIIMPSAVGTVQDMRELVQLAADGKVKTHVSRYLQLSQLNEVLDELHAGKFTGRAVINDLRH
ncbi:MAG: alcohol dehydrogenase catalytic domain-containing protein [Desulfobacteraceae bacterium]|nr:alcohol dehydrogenase catalytic domain-containing protein [Desulfobacteraceae bacterium]